MEDRYGKFFSQAPYMFFLIWMGLAVLLLTIYHCVVLGLRCCLRAQSPVLQPSNRPENLGQQALRIQGCNSSKAITTKKVWSWWVKIAFVQRARVNFKRVRSYELYRDECIHTMNHALICGSIHIQIALSAAPVLPSSSSTTQPQQRLSQAADSDSVRLDSGMLQNMMTHSRAR